MLTSTLRWLNDLYDLFLDDISRVNRLEKGRTASRQNGVHFSAFNLSVKISIEVDSIYHGH